MTVKTRRRFDKRDFQHMADFIVDELDKRKKDRKDLEDQWDEIDRQIRMEFDNSFKYNDHGRMKSGMAWLPETELPLQAQTHEILTADVRRMLFPTNGPWFRAHALMSDEYLNRVDFTSLIAGDENDIPSKVNQDNADKMLEGVMAFVHRQGNFRSQIDAFTAEGFKYGTSVGRVRLVKKPAYIEQARGIAKVETLLPYFYTRSIRETYLDDTPMRTANEGMVIGPAAIHVKTQRLADLEVAAKNGRNDPNDENGGWMPAKLKGCEPDDRGAVEVIEWEGDMVLPRKTVDNIFLPGAIVTVCRSGGDARVIRVRFRKSPFSSYITHPYHIESPGTPYGVSPLMKGAPIQKAATLTFSSLIQTAILNAQPPVQYDPNDPQFVQSGGPAVEPRALWGSVGDLKVHEIGNPAALLQTYSALVAQYSDVTGMHAPRLGQQTVSHTTAFAKEAELSRGQVRTVDYANSLIEDPMVRILEMQFWHLKDNWTQKNIYVPDYHGFLNIGANALPDEAMFEVFGAAGPAEQQNRIGEQVQALQGALAIEQFKIQTGQNDQPLDFTEIQKTYLKAAGIADVDSAFAAPAQAQASNVVPGPGIQSPDQTLSPGVSIAGIQALEGIGGA